ncbi:MAG: metallophosphoesterase [Erysipelotrichaceae bacterium]|nr:metallophosphoesterase [Erysipelotrichaceae bacterium]
MIFVTGDIHAYLDIKKLNSKSDFGILAKTLTRDDYLIICGDFGLVFDLQESKTERYWLKWLEDKPYTVLWCDGNHENYNRLYSDEFPIIDFCGGKAQMIRPHIIHLLRGETYMIDGQRFFVMGGASSHDRGEEVEDLYWWRRELPNDEEYDNALKHLEACNYNVDYIITHCAPSSIQDKVNPYYKNDRLTQFLDEVAHNTTFRKWFFGHYHVDDDINEQFRAIFNDVIQIV